MEKGFKVSGIGESKQKIRVRNRKELKVKGIVDSGPKNRESEIWNGINIREIGDSSPKKTKSQEWKIYLKLRELDTQS